MSGVAVSTVGMISSLGESVVGACAAARAGIRRATEVETYVIGEDEDLDAALLMGHSAIPAGHVAVGKARGLIQAALRDLRRSFDPTTCDPKRTSLHLVFSDSFYLEAWASKNSVPTDALARIDESDAPNLLSWAASELSLSIPKEQTSSSLTGRVGIVPAIERAVAAIEGGTIDHAIIGAVDSVLEPRILDACMDLGVIKTKDNPCGIEAGEAGAFIVLERAEGQPKTRLRIDACATGTGTENRLDPEWKPGNRVRKVVGEALSKSGSSEGVDVVVGDLNGEVFRAHEWGHALMGRTKPSPLSSSEVWMPAASFGETGAATGAIAICMLAQASERGYLNTQRALVWLLDDEGHTGSIVLSTN
ncbi:MAG: 3-oxoacyl-[acyl-carrier-protein] synthase-1 [Planctomycetota bacterium]|jgi:3-oxoacyl-[acyl-carrier-protein] synthase-1